MSVIESPWALPPAVEATRPHLLRSGHTVQMWAPGQGEAHLASWYEPAAALCRSLGATALWPDLRVEQLVYQGRIDPAQGPSLWLYEHRGTGGEILVDVAGQPYSASDDVRRKCGYRFEPATASQAAAALGLTGHRRRRRPVAGGTDGMARVLPFRRPGTGPG